MCFSSFVRIVRGCFLQGVCTTGIFVYLVFILMTMEAATKSPTPHIGRKIARMREMLGVKQEALAHELGITQQAVSKLEQSSVLEEDRLEQVAKVLGVPARAIENFSEETAINIISNTFNDEASAYSNNYKCNFNPLDKVVELYDALLKEKDEKIALLERFLGDGK